MKKSEKPNRWAGEQALTMGSWPEWQPSHVCHFYVACHFSCRSHKPSPRPVSERLPVPQRKVTQSWRLKDVHPDECRFHRQKKKELWKSLQGVNFIKPPMSNWSVRTHWWHLTKHCRIVSVACQKYDHHIWLSSSLYCSSLLWQDGLERYCWWLQNIRLTSYITCLYPVGIPMCF